jgi:branched-chain amino acid transport system ATP-binding protein
MTRPVDNPNATAPLLECRDIERRFGGLVALTGANLQVRRGEIFGLVGPNGSGKTTMTNAITGFFPPQKGSIWLDGKNITGWAPHKVARLGVARTFQNLALFNGMSVLDNILLGRHGHMQPSVLRTAFYSLLAQKDELAQREVVEEIIDFMQWTPCPSASKNAWNWRGLWWPNPRCSSWTSPWPA